MNTKKDKQHETANASQNRATCPNCGQWQNNKKQFAENVPAYWDCYNDCSERGFAPKRACESCGSYEALPDDTLCEGCRKAYDAGALTSNAYAPEAPRKAEIIQEIKDGKR